MVQRHHHRIPEYQVELDGIYEHLGNPSMSGLGKVPVAFTPGVSQETSPRRDRQLNATDART